MFGQLGQLTSLLKNAGKIKQGMQDMNVRLAEARYVGESGGGQVSATVDGRGEIIALKINPAMLQGNDIELAEDLIVAAIRESIRRSREGLQKEMEQATGGLDLGDITKLIGGQP